MSEINEVQGSSRIYVAGFPPYLDEKRLRNTFSERGEVTDAKVMKTRDGKPRQFGFVGFQSAEQAKEAIHYFNNSYIDTCRIQVKFAEKSQSENLQRPWSIHSKGSSRNNKLRRAEAKNEDSFHGRKAGEKRKNKHRDSIEDDSQFEEFLKVMQPRSKTAIWANDDAVPSAAKVAKKEAGITVKAAAMRVQENGIDEDVEYQDLSRLMPEKSSSLKQIPVSEPDQVQDAGESRNLDAVVLNSEISDLDYLKARMRKDPQEDEEAQLSLDDSSDGNDSDDGDSDGSAGTEIKGSDAEQDSDHVQEDLHQRQHSHARSSTSGREDGEGIIAQTGRLFLRNLPYQATETDLKELFEEFGELSEVHLVMDRTMHKSKGFALVQFIDPGNAGAAMAALDGSIFQGRLLHILPAKPLPQSRIQEVEEQNEANTQQRGFQQHKAERQKANASNRVAWNTLFMRADTVAEAVAAHYGISKSQLLDKEAADLPVRMALGEAHVIAMTKAALAEAGVNVEALEASAAVSGKAAALQPGAERSSTVLLVKNLPYSTTEADLLEEFGKAGLVSRIVLPETKTLALVQFHKPGEARHAFKTLAFRRFQSVPLFLEWAPKDIMSPDGLAPQAATKNKRPVKDQGAAEETFFEVSRLKEADEDAESLSIYVKNLSWKTSDASLMKHFDGTVSAAAGSIRAATVAKRKGPDGKTLSAGYGFVECSSETVAKVAIKKLQGTMLDGHKLTLQLSLKKAAMPIASVPVKSRKDTSSKSTKIVVRNVAFEATAKDIRALFQPFGQIKSLRLPKKFDNSHRGFAFVDFLSHQEAVNAMEAIAGTHLYGRRLVTEWAAQEDGLNEIRAKTAAKFQNGAE